MKRDLHNVFNSPHDSFGDFLKKITSLLESGLFFEKEDQVHFNTFLYSLHVPVDNKKVSLTNSYFMAFVFRSYDLFMKGIPVYSGDVFEVGYQVNSEWEKFQVKTDSSNIKINKIDSPQSYIKLIHSGKGRDLSLSLSSDKTELSLRYQRSFDCIMEKLPKIDSSLYDLFDEIPTIGNLRNIIQSNPDSSIKELIGNKINFYAIKDYQVIKAMELIVSGESKSPLSQILANLDSDKSREVLNKAIQWNQSFKSKTK